jgi:hypothetical protein
MWPTLQVCEIPEMLSSEVNEFNSQQRSGVETDNAIGEDLKEKRSIHFYSWRAGLHDLAIRQTGEWFRSLKAEYQDISHITSLPQPQEG